MLKISSKYFLVLQNDADNESSVKHKNFSPKLWKVKIESQTNLDNNLVNYNLLTHPCSRE